MAFLQSLARWPGSPQKRQRFIATRRVLSAAVSLPSEPNLSERELVEADDADAEEADGAEL